MTLTVAVERLATALGAEARRAATATIELPVACAEWIGSGLEHPLRLAGPDTATTPAPAAWIVGPDDPPPDDGTAPILSTTRPASDLRYRAGHFLDSYLPRLYNATLIAIGDRGILIQGPPGCGKSQTAVALVDRGHRMVSDDAVTLQRGPQGGIKGEAPSATAGFAFLRGLGAITIDHHYPGRRLAAHRIDLTVTISPTSDADPLTGGWFQDGIMGRPFAGLQLRANDSLALRIELAAGELSRNGAGADSIQRIQEQQKGRWA